MTEEQWTALGKRKVLEGIEQDAVLAGELAEDSDLQEGYHASQKSARRVFADLKNRLGEFSEKVKLLKDKVRIASKADWLIHEEEAKEKARIRRKRPNNQLNDTEAEVRAKELRRTKLEEVLQECRDCILRIGIFSSEFLESKGWRECLRSIVYQEKLGLIDLYHREVLSILPLLVDGSPTLRSMITHPISLLIPRTEVIEMISPLPFCNSLARYWSAVTLVDPPKLINNGPNTFLNVNMEAVASSGGSLNHLCKVYLTDAHGSCDPTLNLSELTEETSHLFVAADCPVPLIMSLKSVLRSWTPITIIGNETRQNLMSMFAELPGFGVFRGSLISESFCSKLTTSTDNDKHEAVSSYVASIYSKTDSTIRILFPEHNTCQTKLISKLREKGINENMETLKSSKESLESASQKRILFDRYRSTIKHFTDGSLPEKDEIRIYMTPPNSIEALQKVMVRCSAYQNAPSAVVIMYNHEEACRIRNEKILHMASPELLLELLSKIQKSPEGPQLNQLRISKKEFGKQFETAWESAQYLLRDLQVRGILKMEGSYPSEFEIKLSKAVQSSVSNPDFFEFLLSRTKLDGESITSISHTYFSGNLESETISSAVSQSKSPAQVPIQTSTESLLLPRLSAFKQAMTDLNNEGCFSQMKPSEVVIFFKKLDSVSSPELTAAFFSQHEETTLRIKAFDMMTACLMNNGVVALEHIKKPRQNLLGEQLNSILNLYYSSTDKFYQSLADSSKCSLLIPHEVHFIQFDLSQRMISSGLKDLKIFLDSEPTQKAAYRCEPSKSLQTNIFFYRFLPLIRGFQIIKTVCAQIHEAYMNNRELPKPLERISKFCPLILMEVIEKNLDKLGVQ